MKVTFAWKADAGVDVIGEWSAHSDSVIIIIKFPRLTDSIRSANTMLEDLQISN